MSIKPLQTIKDFTPAARFVRGLAGKDLAPLILLETSVTGGRTYHAHKRGGYTEAREVFVDNVIGALFWFGGIKTFNKIIDKIGEKALKIKNLAVDVGKDAVRDPVAHFLKDKTLTKTQLGVFKCAKMASSILLANALLGFVAPRINQDITAKILKKQNHEAYEPMINKFLEHNNNQPSFKGNALALANVFENSTKFQLLSTDLGIAGGRVLNERNTPSRIEKAFRDTASIYFYLFNIPLMYKGLNKLIDGKTSRLDPIASKQVSTQLESMLNGGKMSVKEFTKAALGTVSEVPKELQGEVVSLKQFAGHAKEEIAKRMAHLQPELNGERVLTAKQVKDIFRGGALNQPEFIADVYNVATNGKFIDAQKFVANKSLEQIHTNAEYFVKDIVKKAKNGEITADVIKAAQKENFAKNAIYLGSGFAVSALFLSTIIPKMQYWITKKMTGEDKFPGIVYYNKEKRRKS